MDYLFRIRFPTCMDLWIFFKISSGLKNCFTSVDITCHPVSSNTRNVEIFKVAFAEHQSLCRRPEQSVVFNRLLPFVENLESFLDTQIGFC